MDKNQNDLNHLRHTTAHLLAKAVLELWPGSHNAIGPAIENGFYQDFDLGQVKISEADFPKIEQKMTDILPTWKQFEKKEVSAQQAKELFKHNPYKYELAEEFAKEGKRITVNDPGNFLDLCKGGHIKNPSKELKHFKLLKIAGAYWRGDEKNKMLTRIYGTVFPTKEELDHYLWQQEEAKKRDHKKLGQQLELFVISQEIGGGLPIFLPKGRILRDVVEQFITDEKKKRGYQFVWSPHLAESKVYKRSGHWQKYDAMYPPIKLEDEEYVPKPMNCPHHFQVYLAKPHSYRELPIRIAENGTVYRNEKSGELNGLLRVRSATIDATHTILRHDQIESEMNGVLDLIDDIFKAFGFKEYRARVSIRDPKTPDKYMGKVEVWDQAEKVLIDAAKKRGISYFVGEGEAAFYGPKIDFLVKDSLGREWQLSTVQLDFVQPENFDLNYTDEQGKQAKPAVLHIAILGSIERFIGILIEEYAGAFPLWLSPIQVIILPISEKQLDYAQKVNNELLKNGIRSEVDDQNETLGKKIRNWEMQKVPYIAVVGQREQDQQMVAPRKRGEGNKEAISIETFIEELKVEKNN